MGGSLSSIFSGTGQGSQFNNATGQYGPSALQGAVQGAAKGAGQGLGKSMQQPPQGGGGMGMGAPSATPVDAAYFAPTNFSQLKPLAGNSPIYGGG